MIALFLIFTLFPSITEAQTATREIADWRFPDIAAVFPDPNSPTGAVIVYNPQICQAIGIACGFFKFHEHCHVYLKHQFQPFMHSMVRERDADRCAAYNAPPIQVFHAWKLFIHGGSSSNWHTYGTPLQRARRLCLFAREANNWIGPSQC